MCDNCDYSSPVSYGTESMPYAAPMVQTTPYAGQQYIQPGMANTAPGFAPQPNSNPTPAVANSNNGETWH